MTDKQSKVSYIVTLSITTLVLVATLIGVGKTNFTDADPGSFGINNTIGGISDQFFTQITPSDNTFAIWFIIFSWQALWIIYAWSLSFRSKVPLTISQNTLLFYSLANICAIIWLYTWANQLPQYAFPTLVLCGLFLTLSLGFQCLIIFQITATFQKDQKLRYDLYLAKYLVLNGIVFYSTWVAFMIFINFAAVLQYFSNTSADTVGSLGLAFSFLLALVYFNLENVPLDKYLRPVIVVYPVIIWACYGIFNGQSGPPPTQSRGNFAFTLFYLLFANILLVLRISLLIFFSFKRPIKYPDNDTSAE